jgi:hypothetical protein
MVYTDSLFSGLCLTRERRYAMDPIFGELWTTAYQNPVSLVMMIAAVLFAHFKSKPK